MPCAVGTMEYQPERWKTKRYPRAAKLDDDSREWHARSARRHTRIKYVELYPQF